MKSKIEVLGTIVGGKHYESMARVYSLDSLAPSLLHSMGTGGGNVPLIMINDESQDK